MDRYIRSTSPRGIVWRWVEGMRFYFPDEPYTEYVVNAVQNVRDQVYVWYDAGITGYRVNTALIRPVRPRHDN